MQIKRKEPVRKFIPKTKSMCTAPSHHPHFLGILAGKAQTRRQLEAYSRDNGGSFKTIFTLTNKVTIKSSKHNSALASLLHFKKCLLTVNLIARDKLCVGERNILISQ